MTATTVAASEPVREDAGLATAYRLLWLAVVFDLLAFGIGFDWDGRWHATHAFEDFFLFILGSLVANPIWEVVALPTRAGVVKLTTLAGIVMPVLTGIVDLALRARIP